jgi:hypothetical protein
MRSILSLVKPWKGAPKISFFTDRPCLSALKPLADAGLVVMAGFDDALALLLLKRASVCIGSQKRRCSHVIRS